MRSIDYRIPAGKEILSCRVDYSNENSVPSVLCLHGGGASSKTSTDYLVPVFQEAGRTIIRFDFSGQGDSTGTLKESSLQKRYSEAKAVLDNFKVQGKLTLIGSSMGGYIASSLVKDYDVDKLILFCPAAYSADAWKLGFSRGFTEAIRSEKSYLTSDLPELLSSFQGRALFFIGSEDEVIPGEVTEMYMNALAGAASLENVLIKGCPHPIHRWSKEHPEAAAMIKSRLKDFLASGVEY